MTQAISLSQILREAGHEVVQVAVGKSPRRQIPDFFTKNIQAPLELLESPNFVTDKDHKTVKPFRTIVYSLIKSPVFGKSIGRLQQLVKEKDPDVILNFYDFIGGLYNFLHRPKATFICLAHQYLLGHPEFTFPKGRIVDKTTLLIGNHITRLGANKILALSFRPMVDAPNKKIFVVPPLLRKEISDLKISNDKHLLIYMVNPGYGPEVERFHAENPGIPMHCFWDKKDKPGEWRIDETLTFHQLNDKKFLEKMASAAGYVTTAGFESVCEAMYLGKPTIVIPVEGHYEQACNAIDAEKAGAGKAHHEFDINVLKDYIPKYIPVSDWFQGWVDRNKEIFLKHLVTK